MTFPYDQVNLEFGY